MEDRRRERGSIESQLSFHKFAPNIIYTGLGKNTTVHNLKRDKSVNMICKQKHSKQQLRGSKTVDIHSEACKFVQFIPDKLENTGREQFFHHYPKSKMPIRDIAGSRKSKTGKAGNRGKTEPHIEIGAENYLRSCIQSSIKVFCRNSERYLFLCTTCRSRDIGNGTFFGKRFIIGYIEKEDCVDMGDHLAIIGNTYIVSFAGNLEYQNLGFKRNRGMQKFNETDTQRLLKLIHRHKNIRTDCVSEMIKQEEKARAEGRYIPVDNECLKDECEFRNNCLRRRLQ